MTRFSFNNLRLDLIAMAIFPALIAAEKIKNALPELTVRTVLLNFTKTITN